MTALSELFCDEVVEQAAKIKFGDKIPEWDTIEIPDGWGGLAYESDFPDSGTIKYLDEDEKEIARVHFDVKFEIIGTGQDKGIEATPINLRLEINGKEIKVPTEFDISLTIKAIRANSAAEAKEKFWNQIIEDNYFLELIVEEN
jgi:hypothetical protein